MERALPRDVGRLPRPGGWEPAAGERPARAAAEAALHHHMPELADVHAQLVALAGGDDTAAAMLTLWNPPPFIVACSQVVVPDRDSGEPVLLRNYDYDPRLFEATIYRSRWSTRRVLGTGDCLWGLVDGVNDDGLAVSLTFGGRREVGEGFGIPLVIRYLLEVAGDVAEGIEVLRRLPHQISYNVTLCDRSGPGRHRDDRPRSPGAGDRPARGHQPSRDRRVAGALGLGGQRRAARTCSRRCRPRAPTTSR